MWMLIRPIHGFGKIIKVLPNRNEMLPGLQEAVIEKLPLALWPKHKTTLEVFINGAPGKAVTW
jgi:hypothetical protein